MTGTIGGTRRTDRFRIFEQKILILLAATGMLFGLVLVLIGEFSTGAWHEDLEADRDAGDISQQ